MKKFVSFFLSLAFAGSTFAQMSGYSSSQSDGTTLGANNTLTADGIALGNAVKLRGYVEFGYEYTDMSDGLRVDRDFDGSADTDFLFDFSPLTAELHLNLSEGGDGLLEQAFGRYSFNNDFHLTFGRQVTNLGFESDETPELYTVSRAYFIEGLFHSDAFQKEVIDDLVASGTSRSDAEKAMDELPRLRKNYSDSIRANYNNGMFGLSLGWHDSYWLNDNLNNNFALDIAASVMIVPGLEARLGYAHQEIEDYDIGHFNGWLAYNPGDLTLAIEFDTFAFSEGQDLWDVMLLASYNFSDFISASIRYSHEDLEGFLLDDDYRFFAESDRITFALTFAITNNFSLITEISHTEYDGKTVDAGGADHYDTDADEFYLKGLITY